MDKTLNMLIRNASLFMLMAMTGCQQSHSVAQQKTVPRSQQIEQIASLTAATRYLKNKCNRSDLLDDESILAVGNQVALKKGWQPLSYDDLRKNSDELYQRLTRDSTPEQTKCSDFNRQLVPFTKALQAESRGK